MANEKTHIKMVVEILEMSREVVLCDYELVLLPFVDPLFLTPSSLLQVGVECVSWLPSGICVPLPLEPDIRDGCENPGPGKLLLPNGPKSLSTNPFVTVVYRDRSFCWPHSVELAP